MWKLKCNGPTGQYCHLYDSNGAEVRCLAIDLSISPGKATIASIQVLVDEIDIEIDESNVDTIERTLADVLSTKESDVS